VGCWDPVSGSRGFWRGGERGERGRVWPLGNIRLVTRRVILRCSDLNLICVWRGSGRLLGRDGGVVGWMDGGVLMEGIFAWDSLDCFVAEGTKRDFWAQRGQARMA
jgi:hypothetical protein